MNHDVVPTRLAPTSLAATLAPTLHALVAAKVFDNAGELSIPSRCGGNVLQRRNEPRLKPGDCVKKKSGNCQ